MKLLFCFVFFLFISRVNAETKTLAVIDYPINQSSYSDTLVTIQGWVMSNTTVDHINTYVDNKQTNINYSFYSRPDVIKAITGYGTAAQNPTPGFKGNLDMTNYSVGTHTIKLIFYAKNGTTLYTISRSIKKSNHSAMIVVDYPRNTTTDTNIFFQGWIMSTTNDYNIKLYIDNQLVENSFTRYPRSDVIKAIKGYSDITINTSPGFKGNIDMSKYKDGNHVVRVDAVNSNNSTIGSGSRSFTLKKYNSTMRLDSPVTNYSNNSPNLSLHGWYLSTSKNSSVKVYINNDDVTESINMVARPDAIAAYGNAYGATSSTVPGFEGTIDLSKYNDGNLNIKVAVINNDTEEELTKIERTIKLKKYISTMRLDSPVTNYSNNSPNLSLHGWYLSTSKNSSVKVYINNDDVTESINMVARPDAIAAYGNAYGATSSTVPGFEGTIDVSKYNDGNLNIKVTAINNDTGEELTKIERTIKLKKYNCLVNIDYPTRSNFSSSTNLYIQGWELSTYGATVAKLFIDNKEISLTRASRPDVLAAYPNSYGGAEKNPTPGFSTTVPLNTYSNGIHNIYIKLYDDLDEVIYEKKFSIYIYTNQYFGIDISQYQGNINWDKVSKSGIDFVIIRMGYGDNISTQDDKKFITNVEGCVSHGIPYGLYLYSYAKKVSGSSESSSSEVAHALRLLNSLTAIQKDHLKLPVYIDMEDDSTISLGKTTLTNIANNFCSNIQNKGYTCGVYANKNWLNNYLDSSSLSSKYNIWLAHYVDSSDYKGIYQVWQYSSTGSLSGISGAVDMDISYKKYW